MYDIVLISLTVWLYNYLNDYYVVNIKNKKVAVRRLKIRCYIFVYILWDIVQPVKVDEVILSVYRV